MKFDDHFIRRFLESNEPFGIFFGRLYTLHKPNGHRSPITLVSGQEHYNFEPSEDITDIECRFYRAREQDILTRAVQLNGNKDLEEEVNQLERSIRDLREVSLEYFLLYDVYNHYYHKSNENLLFVQDLKPRIVDILDNENTLHEVLESQQVMSVGGDVFLLTKNETSTYVNLLRSRKYPRRWISLEQLSCLYSMRLGERFDRSIANCSDELNKIRERIVGRHSALQKKLKLKRLGNREHGTRGSFSYQRLGGSTYLLNVKIDPFVIVRDDKYYFFEECAISSEITFTGNSVRIHNIPHVSTPDYEHMFVYNSGALCYNGLNWRVDLDVRVNTNYDISIPKLRDEAAFMIAKAFDRTTRTLEVGYTEDGVENAHPLDPKWLIAENETDAIRFLEQKGFGRERIFDNGYSMEYRRQH